MLQRTARIVSAGLALAMLAGTTANAAPRTHLATCDEVPGQTATTSRQWRLLWLDVDDEASRAPLYACERLAKPVRSLLRMSVYTDVLGFGNGIPSIHGDIARVPSGGRYGADARYFNLRTGATLDGFAVDHDNSVTDQRVLLRSGAYVSFRMGFPAADWPASSRQAAFVSDVSAWDGAGLRTVAPGSVFGNAGQVVAAVEGPYDVAVGDAPASKPAVYWTDATGTPRRSDLQGAATGLPWKTTSAYVSRVPLSFKVTRERRSDQVSPIDHAPMQLRTTQRGRVTLEWAGLVTKNGAKPKSTRVATLASPTKTADVRVVTGQAGDAVIARFANAPTEPRLRIYGGRAGAPQLDTTAPRAADATTLVANRMGDYAYRDGARIIVLGRHATSDPHPYEVATVDAAGARDLAIGDRVVYYTDGTGQPRAIGIPSSNDGG